MNAISTILFSLYFGLLPFDNLKNLNGNTITKIIGIILIIYMIIALLLKKQKKVKLNFVNVYISVIFTIYSFTYFVLFKGYSAYYIRFCFLFLLFILSTQLDFEKNTLKKIFDYSTLIIGIIALNSIFLNLKFSYIDRTHYYIWTNMAVDANVYCSTLIFSIMYSVDNLISKNAKCKMFYACVLISMVLSVLLSGSRGGLLAIIVGVIYIISFGSTKLKIKSQIMFITISIILVGMFLPYLPNNIANRLSLSAVVADKASDRFDIWKYAIRTFANSNPVNMIFGNGFLSFKTVTKLNVVSHNLFIQTLLEGGVLMLGIFITFYCKLLRLLKEKKMNLMIAYVISILVMSCSLDVVVSRFLWNSFMIIFFYVTSFKDIDIEKTA